MGSEGLILMTDDGDLAHKLTHPRYEHPKTYYVLVADRPPASALTTLREGVELPEGKTAPAEVRVVPALPQGIRLAAGPTDGVWLEIVLREGKKRQIRHMTAAVGFPTLRLIRWAIGPLTLDDLKAGDHVPLTRKEVAALHNALRGGATLPPPVVIEPAPTQRRLRTESRPSAKFPPATPREDSRRPLSGFSAKGRRPPVRPSGRPPRNSGNR
jgi:pseudouridine synthase